MLKRVLVQLTPKQIAGLKAVSDKTGASVAWQIREAVDAYLKTKGQK
jgi:predicted DNA-binding protein